MNSIICNNLNLFGRFFESKYLFPENVQDFDIRINEDYLSLHAYRPAKGFIQMENKFM